MYNEAYFTSPDEKPRVPTGTQLPLMPGAVVVVELVEVVVEVAVEDEEVVVVLVVVVVSGICCVLAQPPNPKNPKTQIPNPKPITITNNQTQKLGLFTGLIF